MHIAIVLLIYYSKYLSSLGDVFTKTPTKSLKSRRVKGESFSQRKQSSSPSGLFPYVCFYFTRSKLSGQKLFFSLIFFPLDSGQCGDLLGEFVVFYIQTLFIKKGTQRVLSSSKKTTASLLLLALFSQTRGVCS